MSESKFVKTHMRSKNTSCEVYNYFMLAVCFIINIVLLHTKFTSKVHNYRININENKEIKDTIIPNQ